MAEEQHYYYFPEYIETLDIEETMLTSIDQLMPELTRQSLDAVYDFWQFCNKGNFLPERVFMNIEDAIKCYILAESLLNAVGVRYLGNDFKNRKHYEPGNLEYQYFLCLQPEYDELCKLLGEELLCYFNLTTQIRLCSSDDNLSLKYAVSKKYDLELFDLSLYEGKYKIKLGEHIKNANTDFKFGMS